MTETNPDTASPVSSEATDCICEDETMADVPANIHEQTLSRLSSAGAMAHENFTQFGHILDLKYETDRHQVSLVEALGVREVTSRSGQQGIPIASTINGNTP